MFSATLDWIDRNSDALSVEIAAALAVATILGVAGWIGQRRWRRRTRLAADRAERSPPEPSDPLSFLERRVLRQMFGRHRQLIIDRRADAPAGFRNWALSSKGWLTADRWFFVLKGLADRGLVEWARDTRGGDVFTLNDRGLERCVHLFGTPWQAALRGMLALAAEWGWVVFIVGGWFFLFLTYSILRR